MGKRLFISPEVKVLKLDVGPGEEEGEGSVTYTQDPMDYEKWYEEFQFIDFEFDLDPSDEPGTWNDYVEWMKLNGYEDLINDLNPNHP